MSVRTTTLQGSNRFHPNFAHRNIASKLSLYSKIWNIDPLLRVVPLQNGKNFAEHFFIILFVLDQVFHVAPSEEVSKMT